MINKLWSMLFRDVPIPSGDWLRNGGTAVAVSSTALTLIRTILPDTDLHIRGWLTEAWIQLALRSTYKNALLAADPENNYNICVLGEHAHFSVTFPSLENKGAVVATTVNREVTRYRHVAECIIDAATGNYTTVLNGVSVSGVGVIEGRTFHGITFNEGTTLDMTIPVDSGATVNAIITGRILPKGPAGRILSERFRTASDIGILDIPLKNDLTDSAGKALMRVLEVV